MKTKKRDAMDEVGVMMGKPMKDIPKPAMDYLKDLSSRIGFCGEVCVTAYAAYCQAVLKMPCTDPAYKITKEAKQWFINYKKTH